MQLVRSKFVNVVAFVDGQTIQFKEHMAMVSDEVAMKLSARDGYEIMDRMQYRTAKRILIIRSMGIGDVLFCTTVPKFIKKVNPDCHLTFATFERHFRILQHNPNVDQIITIPTHVEAFKDYDWIGNFQGFFEDPMANRENWNRQNELHRVDMLRNYFLLEPNHVDAKLWDNDLDYFVADEDRAWAKQRLEKFHVKRKIAYFTQASETTRRHPLNPEIIKLLASRGYGVMVISPGGDHMQGENILNLSGQTTIAQMGSLIEAADLVVAPDTGPLHMAGALQKKIVTFFNSFPPQTRVAYYKNCFAFYPKEACPRMPCNYSHCPASCFLTVTPDMVLAKVEEMLETGVKK